jgi:hypothetical protein
MQRGVDMVRQAEGGCALVVKRIGEIDVEIADLEAEREQAIGYLNDMRDKASAAIRAAGKPASHAAESSTGERQ